MKQPPGADRLVAVLAPFLGVVVTAGDAAKLDVMVRLSPDFHCVVIDPQIVVPKGNHFPMCDDPDRVANPIRGWHHELFSRAGETWQ